MRRRARLHADKTGCKLAEECDHLPASQLPRQDHSPIRIDAVNLENALG
jgi:hypothetical protein